MFSAKHTKYTLCVTQIQVIDNTVLKMHPKTSPNFSRSLPGLAGASGFLGALETPVDVTTRNEKNFSASPPSQVFH